MKVAVEYLKAYAHEVRVKSGGYAYDVPAGTCVGQLVMDRAGRVGVVTALDHSYDGRYLAEALPIADVRYPIESDAA